jgi:hypothetical protein
MSTRNEVTLRFKVGQRRVTVKAMDAVGVEDAYEVQLKSVIHRYATGEDLTMPTPREVKDFILRVNLNI